VTRVIGLFLRGLLALFLALMGLGLAQDGEPGWSLLLFGSALVVLYYAYRAWRRQPTPDAPAGRRPASLVTPLVIAALLVGLDVVLAGGGVMFTFLAFVGLVLVGLPWAVFAWRDRPILLTRLRSLGIVLLAGVLICAWFVFDDGRARDNLLAAAAALNQYKAKAGRYPGTLEDLVPAHLPRLPQARSFGLGEKVYYRVDKEGAATLMYTSMPPFTRAVLDVQSGTWSVLD
jgi:hypothetical protein